MAKGAVAHGNGHNPRLVGWFMPEPLDTKVLERVLMLRAWRERNAITGALIGFSQEQGMEDEPVWSRLRFEQRQARDQRKRCKRGSLMRMSEMAPLGRLVFQGGQL